MSDSAPNILFHNLSAYSFCLPVIAGETFDAGRMMVFRLNDPITVVAGETGIRLMLLGGESLNGPRYISWDFVASSREKLEAAKHG